MQTRNQRKVITKVEARELHENSLTTENEGNRFCRVQVG